MIEGHCRPLFPSGGTAGGGERHRWLNVSEWGRQRRLTSVNQSAGPGGGGGKGGQEAGCLMRGRASAAQHSSWKGTFWAMLLTDDVLCHGPDPGHSGELCGPQAIG